MLSKEEIECCKNEAKDYIEFMETAGDNAGWTRGLMWYIEQLESREQKLIEKLEEINTRNAELYNSPKQKEVDFSEWNLAQELLEILKKE